MTRSRFSNCACRRCWKQMLTRWRVLKEGEARSKLYCLDCRFEWWSKCRYRLKLQTHRKRQGGTVTDDEVLVRLFQRCDLQIDPLTAVVESMSRTGEWRELQQVPDSHDSGYRFVNICFQGRKRKIGVHVLQVMQSTGKAVPDGYDVDHITSPPRPQVKDNSLANLRIVRSRLNQARMSDHTEFDFMEVPF